MTYQKSHPPGLLHQSSQDQTPTISQGQSQQPSGQLTEQEPSTQPSPSALDLEILREAGINVEDKEALALGLEMLEAFG